MTDNMEVDTVINKAITRAEEDKPKSTKSHDIYTTTIKTPPCAYAYLQIVTAKQEVALDEITLRQYLTSALKQYLGLTGMGIAIDILKVSGLECWVRVPRQDLGAFSAALTTWTGSGPVSGLRICAAGDWLGALVARHDQRKTWEES